MLEAAAERALLCCWGDKLLKFNTTSALRKSLQSLMTEAVSGDVLPATMSSVVVLCARAVWVKQVISNDESSSFIFLIMPAFLECFSDQF